MEAIPSKSLDFRCTNWNDINYNIFNLLIFPQKLGICDLHDGDIH